MGFLFAESKTEKKPESSKEHSADKDKGVEAKIESMLQTVRKAENRTAAVREWDIGKTGECKAVVRHASLL